MSNEKYVHIFGDSVMKGIILDDDTKRYCVSKKLDLSDLENNLPIKIKNNARFGCTIDKGYKQILSLLEKDLKCDLAILEYGGNDCDFNWAKVCENPYQEHIPNTDIGVFKATYETMITKLKSLGIKPLVLSLPPIDANRYFKWITRNGLPAEKLLAFLKDINVIYRYQELYSNLATQIACKMDCAFLDIRKAFLKYHKISDLICLDGIHPNEKGQEIILSEFKKYYNLAF